MSKVFNIILRFLPAALGVLFGLSFIISNSKATYLLVLLTLVAAIFAFMWINRGIRLMAAGNFEGAISIWKGNLHNAKKGRHSIVIYQYNLANSYTWKGDYEEALSWLIQVPEEGVPKNLRFSYYFLFALNSFFLRRPLSIVKEFAEKASKQPSANQGELLFLTFVADLMGDSKSADEYVAKYRKIVGKRKVIQLGFFSILLFPVTLREMQSHFFLASYYLKRNQTESAKTHLNALRKVRFPNCYSLEAENLLKGG